ncbi:MAG: hypothetical protein ABIR56_11940, partial [Polaromonas sp.]
GGQAVPVAAVAVLALPVASLVFGAPSMGENAIQAACCTSEYEELSPALISQLQASLSLHGPDAVAITRTAVG